jgi:tight adherence protein C
MIGILVLAALVLWTGTTLVLSERRWFARRPLTERLRPYEPGGLAPGPEGVGGASATSLAEVVSGLARTIGERTARLVGVEEDLATKLDRLHSPVTPTDFRLRQLGWAGAGLVAGSIAASVARPPAALGLLLLLGGPALALLAVEQQLAMASDRRKRRLFLEMPVVAEQLGMLLSAGYSLGSALYRLADRGSGASGQDLRRVVARVRQGVDEVQALREWGSVADVGAVSRLVTVLALDREAGDLARLVAEEARSVRRDVHRELIEQMERRSQQVWIPVTVAALVPGAIFIAVPFIHALRAFGST